MSIIVYRISDKFPSQHEGANPMNLPLYKAVAACTAVFNSPNLEAAVEILKKMLKDRFIVYKSSHSISILWRLDESSDHGERLVDLIDTNDSGLARSPGMEALALFAGQNIKYLKAS
jgi:hypothetical protein